MRFLLLAVLVCGCGSVSGEPAAAGGRGGGGGAAGAVHEQTGGAGGELAAAGGAAGGIGGAGGELGAAGAGGAIPECPKIGTAAITPPTDGSHNCLVGCQANNDAGIATGPALTLCRLSSADAQSWSVPDPAFCVQYDHNSGSLPSVCN